MIFITWQKFEKRTAHTEKSFPNLCTYVSSNVFTRFRSILDSRGIEIDTRDPGPAVSTKNQLWYADKERSDEMMIVLLSRERHLKFASLRTDTSRHAWPRDITSCTECTNEFHCAVIELCPSSSCEMYHASGLCMNRVAERCRITQSDEFHFLALRAPFLSLLSSSRFSRPASTWETERSTGPKDRPAFAHRRKIIEGSTANAGVSGTLGIISLYTYRATRPTWLVQWQSWLVSREIRTCLLLLFH